jgi:hypothetical protein
LVTSPPAELISLEVNAAVAVVKPFAPLVFLAFVQAKVFVPVAVDVCKTVHGPGIEQLVKVLVVVFVLKPMPAPAASVAVAVEVAVPVTLTVQLPLVTQLVAVAVEVPVPVVKFTPGPA